MFLYLNDELNKVLYLEINLLLEKISIKLFFDFVPPCEEIPDFLFITIKSLLSSINDFSFSSKFFFEGLYFSFFLFFFK